MNRYLRHRVRVAGEGWIITCCHLCFLTSARFRYTTRRDRVTCRRCQTLQRQPPHPEPQP